MTHYITEICQKASLVNHPIEQCFFLLTHIAYLQAFTDVNKRTSRLSANIPLIKHNLVPLSFNHVDTQDYISALLVVYEFNDVSVLLDLFIRSYLNTCQTYNATAESFGIDTTRVRYRQQRRDLISAIVTQQLVGNVLTQFVNQQTEKLITKNDQKAFKKNLYDDLKLLSAQRISGMGITKEQLNQWLHLFADQS